MDDPQRAVGALLPLAVAAVEVADPFFNIRGDGWNLAVNSDFVLRFSDGRVIDGEMSEPELGAVRALEGAHLTGAVIARDLRDAVFTFGDLAVLEIVPDTDLDPWVFRAAGLPYVLVGTGPGGSERRTRTLMEEEG
ncbi:hypothetical protein [Sediminivirga luteola]|uniref:hypothetical protein n=1 Tax=Sediminivirga luteola TaxID=1774748 RepID=UPI001F5884BA|nr:hypothetical protein [Sediminivirga luteola]MCI2266027.1 hypothetical protein [Sediminivirga luteola]